MRDAAVAANDANLLLGWCGLRDVSVLTRELLHDEAGLEDGVADLFVLFGGGVTGTLETLAGDIRAGVARRYAIVGGRGHATYWLDRAMREELERSEGEDAPAPVPGVSSEAEMLDHLLAVRYDLHADLLETRSTNCGNNIAFLLDLLEGEGHAPESVILCQDAVMQRRMDATWRRQARERRAFAETSVVNWAAYEAELACDGDRLVWRKAPGGIWPLETFLQLLLGEVDRLTDNELGYGPCGRDYVVHVEVPSEVSDAACRLRDACGEEGRPPDERYA